MNKKVEQEKKGKKTQKYNKLNESLQFDTKLNLHILKIKSENQ